ncbi:hypothetical protein C2845_PM03G33120 [Panicum miliaceum]|uniref:Uncharacterized protein n=1 Tax=Panicum miliaceum TaxID=4540 RepID=A0A3L6T592_PANMI|nr:hypothetical protein C2845_PM03G33120 [Panicum miliaceum]
MDTTAATAAEEADVSSSPLDPSHAPLLLFDYGQETAARKASDAEFFFYSIPKKQVLATRMDEMTDHR